MNTLFSVSMQPALLFALLTALVFSSCDESSVPGPDTEKSALPESQSLVHRSDSFSLLDGVDYPAFDILPWDGRTEAQQIKLGNGRDSRFTDRKVSSYVDTGVSLYWYSFSAWTPDVMSKLESVIVPIVMGYIRGGMALDSWFFDFHYETNFGLHTGDVKSGDAAAEMFNFDKNASFMMQLAAGFHGVELRYNTEHYKFGYSKYTYDYVTDDGWQTGTEHLQFETRKKQFDGIYHFNWAYRSHLGGVDKTPPLLDLYVGYRYLNFRSLRIVYTGKEASSRGSDEYEMTIVAESDPQMMTTNLHLVGVGISNYKQPQKGSNFFYAAELYAGGGYLRGKRYGFYYDPDEVDSRDVEKNRTETFLMASLAPGFTVEYYYMNSFGGLKYGLFARYDLAMYANTSDPTFYSNDGDGFHRLSFGAKGNF